MSKYLSGGFPMKKIITFTAALALSVCAFGVTHNVRTAKAALTSEQVTDMQTMMGKYINAQGRYTKKSRIFIDKEVAEYDVGIFHAKHDVLERTTYYTADGLLMGNLDDTFTSINSGYANNGANMDHFRSEDGVNGLLNPASRTVDYTVTGKTMADYFYNLNDLIGLIDEDEWVLTDGQFKHQIESLVVTDGEYNDTTLKAFQYFAAPMLLQSAAEHYLTPDNIIVKEEGGALIIRIYASSSDSGKLTRDDNLLAESRVYAGFVTPGYYLVGQFGGSYDWQIEGGRVMQPKGDNKAQVENVPLNAGDYQICQLNNYGETVWYNTLGETPVFAEIADGNVRIKYDGTYSFYLNGSSLIYLARHDYKVATFHFVYTDSSWAAWDPRPYGFSVHLTSTQNGEVHTWGTNDEKMIDDNGNYSLEVYYNGDINGVWFYFRQNDEEKKTLNILGELQIFNNNDITINVDVAGLKFEGGYGEITAGVTLSK